MECGSCVRTASGSDRIKKLQRTARGSDTLIAVSRVNNKGDNILRQWEFQLLEDHTPLQSVTVMGAELMPGDHVRIRPNGRGDILDLALRGKTGLIESIEQDYESRVHIAVVIDDDPGRELGMMRQTAHRFFFSPEEVEPV